MFVPLLSSLLLTGDLRLLEFCFGIMTLKLVKLFDMWNDICCKKSGNRYTSN